MKKILIIAGSDSGAGAGIQADLKTTSANGVYASTVITSITAQNTLGVQSVFHLPQEVIFQQIESVLSDIGADYIKTGMLVNQDVIDAVSDGIKKFGNDIKIICDPVMVAKGGHKLLDENSVNALKDKIIAKSYLVTPNIPETEVLSGIKIYNVKDMILAGKKIIAETGCNAVLVKGGHLENKKLTDVLVQKNSDKIFKITKPKIDTKNTHGTGCSYASAITANLAKGENLENAIKKARNYIHKAILASFEIGGGHSPINHFYKNIRTYL